jgi:hypothetical protein
VRHSQVLDSLWKPLHLGVTHGMVRFPHPQSNSLWKAMEARPFWTSGQGRYGGISTPCRQLRASSSSSCSSSSLS